MRNKKAPVAAALGFTMILGLVQPVNVQAAVKKDENVYVTLQEDGSVAKIYVVNAFTMDTAETVTDYGTYSNLKNLTTDDTISEDNGKVTLQLPEGKFYYQGSCGQAQLPWNIQITYKLDKTEISAEDLAGKSGKLEIGIKVRKNKAADSDFFDNYLLQATVKLDTDKCKNITTEGATEANVGSDRQLLYNILAGQEKEISITADVTDFEMDGITFQGVPMQFAIDRDTIDLSELTDKTNEITDVADEFDDGAGKLEDASKEAKSAGDSVQKGAGELASGINSYTAGADQLASGINGYVNGVGQLASGARQLEGLENLGQVSTAIQKLSDAVDGDKTQSLSAGATQLSGGLKQLKAYVDQLVQMPGGEAYKELQVTVDQLYAGSVSVKDGVDAVGDGLNELEKSTGSFPQAAKGVKRLNDGFVTLQKNDKALLSGASQLQSSSKRLKDGAASLSSGAGQLADGLNELSSGNSELKDKTAEFKDKTKDMDSQIDDAVDDMLDQLSGKDYEPKSFVSDENTDIGLVQFVIRTDDIKKAKAETTEKTKKTESFFDKLKALF